MNYDKSKESVERLRERYPKLRFEVEE